MTDVKLLGGTYDGETRTNPPIIDEDQPMPYIQVYSECYVQTEEVDDEGRQIFKHDPSMKGPLS